MREPFLLRFAVGFIGTLLLSAVAAAMLALTFWLIDRFGGYGLAITVVVLAAVAGLMHATTPERSDAERTSEGDRCG